MGVNQQKSNNYIQIIQKKINVAQYENRIYFSMEIANIAV